MLTVDISLPDFDELRALVEAGQERGVLVFDEVVAVLEEIDLSKEQIDDFHAYLLEHGIEIVDADGQPRLATDVEAGGQPPEAGPTAEPPPPPLRPYLPRSR